MTRFALLTAAAGLLTAAVSTTEIHAQHCVTPYRPHFAQAGIQPGIIGKLVQLNQQVGTVHYDGFEVVVTVNAFYNPQLDVDVILRDDLAAKTQSATPVATAAEVPAQEPVAAPGSVPGNTAVLAEVPTIKPQDAPRDLPPASNAQPVVASPAGDAAAPAAGAEAAPAPATAVESAAPAAAPTAAPAPQAAPVEAAPEALPTPDAPQAAPAAAPAAPATGQIDLAAMVGQWQASNEDLTGRRIITELNVDEDGAATLRRQTRGDEPFAISGSFELTDGQVTLVDGDRKLLLGDVAMADDRLVLKRDSETLTFSRL